MAATSLNKLLTQLPMSSQSAWTGQNGPNISFTSFVSYILVLMHLFIVLNRLLFLITHRNAQ